MTKVGAHQPNFLPWSGFWHRLMASDVFVLCAGMQYVHRSYGNRVQLPDGGTWATIPVTGASLPYRRMRIADHASVAQIGRRIQHWARGHSYKFRTRLDPIVERLVTARDEYLHTLNIDLIDLVGESIGPLTTRIVVDENERESMSAAEKICDIVCAHGNTYMCGASGPRYVSRLEIERISDVYVQELSPDVPSFTVLEIVARDADPGDVITSLGRWEKWE